MCCGALSSGPTTTCPSRLTSLSSSLGSRVCSGAKTWLEKQPDAEHAEEFRFAGKRLDFSRQVLERDGVEKRLTVMEATLLRFLVEREGRPVERRVLLEEVWGVRKDTDTRTVDNFIARLRRAIEDEPSNPRHLQTVRGVGYRFVAEPDSD